jgi:dipeptidyl aminopeptidase/acylaminoacyl peptidase
VQLLANRGYAVLQVNYRGSSGYGKRFMNLGNKQWGTGSMQHDLTDAVRWAIEKGIADPQRVCIMGGSYGGYAVLAGLAFTPQLYACGVDLVGISNVASFMKSIPPYWQPLRYEWLHRVGNVEGNATLNRRISPLFHVDKIRAPLFIAQGANDPRVPQAESDQMFTAMKAKGLDVRYMLYSDEGHGLDRAANRLDYNSRVEQFLAEHLGGRAAAPLEVKDAAARVISSAADLSAIAAEEQREEAKAAAAAAAAGGGGSSPSGGSQPADAAPVGAAATAAVNTRRRVPG